MTKSEMEMMTAALTEMFAEYLATLDNTYGIEMTNTPYGFAEDVFKDFLTWLANERPGAE